MGKTVKIILWILLIAVISLGVSENILYSKGYKLKKFPTAKNEEQREIQELYQVCGWAPRTKSIPSFEDPDQVENNWTNGQRVSRKNKVKISPYNVLVLGCSYTLGEGVKDQDTYVWHLNENFPNITFDNYGTSGYGAYQCLLMERCLLKRHKYDLVIYASIKDHPRRNTEFTSVAGAYELVDAITPYVKYSPNGLIYYPSETWPFERYLITVNFLKRLYIRHKQLKAYKAKEKPLIPNQQKVVFLELTRQMKKSAEEKGAKFLTVSLDWDLTSDYKAMPYMIDSYLNLDIPLIHSPLGHVKGKMNFHPNGKVHKIWADKITSWIKENSKDLAI